jgi:hypothetical protein
MAYINQPADLRSMFNDLDNRIKKLENAVRFTAPDVAAEPTYPRIGDIIYNNTEDYMEYWNGTEWVVFGDNNVGVPIVSYTPVWSSLGTAPIYGTGAVTGKYMKISKWVFWSVTVNLTTVTNFGIGQYTLTVPFAPLQHNAMRDGGLHEGSNHYGIMLDIGPATGTTGKMYYNGSSGKDEPFNKNSPHNLTTSDFWYISGAYLIA